LNDSLPIVASGQSFNQENDACQNLTGHEYQDSIVLIHQGDCNSLIKVKHAQEAGAKAVIIYTDTRNATTSIEGLSNAVLPVAFINSNDAELIYSAISSKDSATKARFTNILLAMKVSESEIDSIGGFSSLGPTNELQLKPELAAIGGNVFSTLPTYQKSYGVRSGTSFSCPYIAGSIALFLANNNAKQSPDLVKNALMNFASPGNVLFFCTRI
jgi:subtilisin family serine protease